MARMKIGIMIDSLKLPVNEGLKKAKELGAKGIQVYAVAGEMAPENMSAAARKEFKTAVRELDLEIAALCGDLGGHGFEKTDENAAKIERSKRIVNLAVELGTGVVTTHIGVVPEEKSSLIYEAMHKACRELGNYAAEKGVSFAIETGPEPAARLKSFLDDVGSKGMGVNMDPANLIMVLNEDPVGAVKTLGEYIVHTHAKDGVQLQPCDPVQVYEAFAVGGVEGLDFGKLFNELPLGEGMVPWDGYLKALKDIGFSGYLTIEREVGDDPIADIQKAVDFLRSKIYSM